MKRLTKLLLTLCTWFLFLWFSFAQNQQSSYEDGGNLYTDDGDTNINSEFNSWNQYQRGSPRANPEWEPNIIWEGPCTCGGNMLEFILNSFLFLVIILLWIMLIITSLYTKSLYKKLANTYKHNILFYFPIINLYPLSKMTGGKIRFFILILLLWFFIYNVYVYKIFENSNLCCHNPIRQGYSWIIVWICSIVILGVLLSKLSYLIKPSQENSGKKSPNE